MRSSSQKKRANRATVAAPPRIATPLRSREFLPNLAGVIPRSNALLQKPHQPLLTGSIRFFQVLHTIGIEVDLNEQVPGLRYASSGLRCWNSFGNLTACELPLLNTFAILIFAPGLSRCIYGKYLFSAVRPQGPAAQPRWKGNTVSNTRAFSTKQ